MEVRFNHFIITRFNLKQTIWEKDKLGDAVNNEAWLSSRYELFERFCLPSIIHQTEQEFKWLVFFDTHTPITFKVKNERNHADFKNFIPVYVDSFLEFEKSLDSIIRAQISNDPQFIITTRLDNDDCLHENAVKTIQHHFIDQDRTVIDLIHGLTLQINPDYKLALKKHTSSGPFISLIEKHRGNRPFMTVYDREHLHWIGDAHFVTIDDGIFWMQIIHDRNISNALSEELTFKKQYLKGFNFRNRIHFSFKYYMLLILKKTLLYNSYKKIKNHYIVF
jgi:hypothetical protein